MAGLLVHLSPAGVRVRVVTEVSLVILILAVIIEAPIQILADSTIFERRQAATILRGDLLLASRSTAAQLIDVGECDTVDLTQS